MREFSGHAVPGTLGNSVWVLSIKQILGIQLTKPHNYLSEPRTDAHTRTHMQMFASDSHVITKIRNMEKQIR